MPIQLDEEGQKCLRQISIGLERMADLVAAVLAHAQVGTSAIGSAEAGSWKHALGSGDRKICEKISRHRER